MKHNVKLQEKLCYGLGALGGNIPNYLIVGYITLFATDVMHVSALAVGRIILICSVFDAVTDLIVTNIADRTHSRWGKYRPWLLFTSVPMAITMVLLFWYPDFLTTERLKIIWLFSCYFILSPVLLTGYLCPQYVLLSVITDDVKERMILGSARSIGEFISDLLVNGLCMTLILWLGDDYKSIDAWRITVMIFSTLALICAIAGFGGVRERVQISNRNAAGNQLTLCEKLTILFRSPTYIKVLSLNFGIIFSTIETVLFPYFCIYDLAQQNRLALYATLACIASIATSSLIPTLGQKLSMRTTLYLGCGCLAGAGIGYLFANNFSSMLILVFLKGMGYGITITCSGILWATTSDYISESSGVAIPGLVMATGSFLSKISMGICTFIGTLVLSISRFDATLPVQSNGTRLWIRYGIATALLVSALLTVVYNSKLHELYNKKLKREVHTNDSRI